MKMPAGGIGISASILVAVMAVACHNPGSVSNAKMPDRDRDRDRDPDSAAAPVPSTEQDDDRAPGWEAIDAALDRLYPGQEPLHLMSSGLRWIVGGENPLDGIDIFDAGTFWHYVGFGLTELYAPPSEETVSGLGYEFTFRLQKLSADESPPTWPEELLNGLGRPAMLDETGYYVYSTVETGPFRGDPAVARYVGVIFQEDPGLPSIDTPNGSVMFLQLVPVDGPTLQRAKGGNGKAILAELGALDPAFVTRRQ